MDKTVNQLTSLSSLNFEDKLLIQQSNGVTVNTTCGNFINLIKQQLNLPESEVIFESANRNTATTINLMSGKNFANYSYVEIFAETSDGESIYNKVYNPNGKTIAICNTSIGGYSWIFLHTKTYKLSGSQMTVPKTTVNTSNDTFLSGAWFYNQGKVAQINTEVIGITKIIGYK